MKYCIYFSLVFISFLQDSETIVIKTDLSKRSAVIFKEGYQDILLIPNKSFRFTPTLKQVLVAENKLCKAIKNFDNMYRQYAGYISTEGDSIIICNIMKPRLVRKHKQIWKIEYIYGLGEFYQRNQRISYFSFLKGDLFNP